MARRAIIGLAAKSTKEATETAGDIYSLGEQRFLPHPKTFPRRGTLDAYQLLCDHWDEASAWEVQVLADRR